MSHYYYYPANSFYFESAYHTLTFLGSKLNINILVIRYKKSL